MTVWTRASPPCDSPVAGSKVKAGNGVRNGAPMYAATLWSDRAARVPCFWQECAMGVADLLCNHVGCLRGMCLPVWYSVAASTRYARRSQFSENRRCERSWLLMGTDRPDLHVTALPCSYMPTTIVPPVFWNLSKTTLQMRGKRGFHLPVSFLKE